MPAPCHHGLLFSIGFLIQHVPVLCHVQHFYFIYFILLLCAHACTSVSYTPINVSLVYSSNILLHELQAGFKALKPVLLLSPFSDKTLDRICLKEKNLFLPMFSEELVHHGGKDGAEKKRSGLLGIIWL